MGDLCDIIGFVVECLLSGSTSVTASPSCHDPAIQEPSLVLFMYVGDPYIPSFYIPPSKYFFSNPSIIY